MTDNSAKASGRPAPCHVAKLGGSIFLHAVVNASLMMMKRHIGYCVTGDAHTQYAHNHAYTRTHALSLSLYCFQNIAVLSRFRFLFSRLNKPFKAEAVQSSHLQSPIIAVNQSVGLLPYL